MKEGGILIAIEGIDGVGKTTQAQRLRCRLFSRFYVPVFSDPPNSKIGKEVRSLITKTKLSSECNLILVSGARSLYFRDKVKSWLDNDQIVIADRFIHTSVVYNPGYEDLAFMLHTEGCGRYPDKVFVLDLPVEEAMKRIKNPDVLESVDIEVIEERRKRFIDLGKLPEVEVIDTLGLTKEAVSDKLFVRTKDFLIGEGCQFKKHN